MTGTRTAINISISFAIGLAIIAAGTGSALASTAEVIANVAATNPSDFARNQEATIIAFKAIGLSPSDPRVTSLYVMDKGRVVSSETIDSDNDGKADALIIVDNYAAHAAHHISIISDPAFIKPAIKKQTQAEISIKQGGQWDDRMYVGGRFVNVQHVKLPPQYAANSTYIRYEGPGIESDKVAYRVYLDPRNGFDLFGKKTSNLVLQNIGQDDTESYENDAPWGLDILNIGKSLGSGGFGYWNGKQVEQVADTESREASIVANGNLYSAFNIQYNHWHVKDAVYEMSATIAMTAGSRLAHTQVQLVANEDTKIAMPIMAIGVVKHADTRVIQSGHDSKLEWGYAASWGKQSRIAADEYLGMAVLFHRAQRVQQTEDAESYVSVINTNQESLEYYFLAAWDKEPGGIKTETEFKAYLDNEVQRLSTPLTVMIAKPHNMHIH